MTNLRRATGSPACRPSSNAIRATGATQPVMVGGLDYADDLSQWARTRSRRPAEPRGGLLPQLHGEGMRQRRPAGTARSPRSPPTCRWSPASSPRTTTKTRPVPTGPELFDEEYMDWADPHGVSYLAWAWIVESRPRPNRIRCSALLPDRRLLRDARLGERHRRPQPPPFAAAGRPQYLPSLHSRAGWHRRRWERRRRSAEVGRTEDQAAALPSQGRAGRQGQLPARGRRSRARWRSPARR